MNIITSKLNPEKAQSDEQKIQTATARAVDRTYFKLQKNYDVFKPLSALVLGDKPKDCSAKIGMKEGLEGGEKFDVLKPSFNRKTGASRIQKSCNYHCRQKKCMGQSIYRWPRSYHGG